MTLSDLEKEDIAFRKELADRAHHMVAAKLAYGSAEDSVILTSYHEFYLQISFTQLHPLMVICLMRKMEGEPSVRMEHLANELNQQGVLGCHMVSENYDLYYYRTSHWLDTELTETRFFEILSRCLEDATRGYVYINS